MNNALKLAFFIEYYIVSVFLEPHSIQEQDFQWMNYILILQICIVQYGSHTWLFKDKDLSLSYHCVLS